MIYKIFRMLKILVNLETSCKSCLKLRFSRGVLR